MQGRTRSTSKDSPRIHELSNAAGALLQHIRSLSNSRSQGACSASWPSAPPREPRGARKKADAPKGSTRSTSKDSYRIRELSNTAGAFPQHIRSPSNSRSRGACSASWSSGTSGAKSEVSGSATPAMACTRSNPRVGTMESFKQPRRPTVSAEHKSALQFLGCRIGVAMKLGLIRESWHNF